MFEKSLTNEEWLLKKGNTGYFTELPDELINKFIHLLSYYDLSQLQLTSYFWAITLSNLMQEKAKLWDIIGAGDYLIFISGKGHAFNIEHNYSSVPSFVSIPSKLPICTAVTNGFNNFYLDEQKNWFAYNNNTSGQVAQTRPIGKEVVSFCPFNDNSKLDKIIAVNNVSFMNSYQNQWFSCGEADSGRLGLGEIEQSYFKIPQSITLPNMVDIAKIKANGYCTFFMDKTGGWHGCGYNWDCVLSKPNITEQNTFFKPFPITLSNNKAVKDIVAGDTTTFFLDIDGDWFGCGNNDYGVLGVATYPAVVQLPVKISLPNNKKILKLISKSNNTFFRDQDNDWFACGNNSDGQLGIGVNDQPSYTPLPVKLPDNTVITKVVSVNRLTYFQNNNNQWFGCGNGNKELHGFGKSNTPVLIDFSIFKKPNQEHVEESQNTLTLRK